MKNQFRLPDGVIPHQQRLLHRCPNHLSLSSLASGYQLLRNSEGHGKDLLKIPMPAGGFSIDYFKSVLGEAKGFLRDLQKDIVLVGVPLPGPHCGCCSMYIDTSTFSPPWSDLTLEGSPYSATTCWKRPGTVAAVFFVPALRYTGSLVHPSPPPCITILHLELKKYMNLYFAIFSWILSLVPTTNLLGSCFLECHAMLPWRECYATPPPSSPPKKRLQRRLTNNYLY